MDKVLRMLILKGISTTATCCFYMVKGECDLHGVFLASVLQSLRLGLYTSKAGNK